MTVLALDVGNTDTKAARWDGRAWTGRLRWPTAGAVPPALAALAHGADAAGLASVAPRHTGRIAAAVRDASGRMPVFVSAALPLASPTLRFPFAMRYRTPETLGADRLAAAVAAWTGWGGSRPVVALDAGTAVTLDVVAPGPDGPAYLGGAIAPGPELLRRTLARDTGGLPDVPFAVPPSPIGASTAEAIQSGVTVLVVDGVAGLLRRTADVLGAPPVVVATGGWAAWLAGQGLPIDAVEDSLVLDGVRLLCAPG